MQKVIFILALVFFIAGCRSYANHVAPPGEMGADGKVNKCTEHRVNPQACGEALYNAPRVAKVNLGQSVAEVRQIMGRDPEERLVRIQDGDTVEVWAYLVNYANSTKGVINFKNGKVVSVESMQKK